MPIQTHETQLPALGPGTALRLVSHEFSGTGSTRSAYIQAGLHADEHPGLLVIQHLLEILGQLHEQGRILGRIVIRPFANPVGLTQNLFGCWAGRFNLANGENFNRNFPDLLPALDAQLANAAHLVSAQAPQQLLVTALETLPAHDAVSATRQALLRDALEHDLVLDLHCDTAGVLHLYSTKAQRERAVQLAAAMGMRVVFLEERAGGRPFDESCNRTWHWLVENGFVEASARPFAASIELRGQADVDDQTAYEDALGLLRFLASEGLVRLDDSGAMPVDAVQVYPLEGASHLPSPGNGLLVWKKRPGDTVARGELIAELVPIDAPLGSERIPICSDVDGVIVVQPLFKLVRSGQRVALLAGTTPLAHRMSGQLLQHF